MRRADQVRLQLRQPPLGIAGMLCDQVLANDKAEDRIAEEFELLVIIENALEIFLIDARLVSQRAFQEFAVLEGMAQCRFESLQAGVHGASCRIICCRRPEVWPAGSLCPSF